MGSNSSNFSAHSILCSLYSGNESMTLEYIGKKLKAIPRVKVRLEKLSRSKKYLVCSWDSLGETRSLRVYKDTSKALTFNYDDLWCTSSCFYITEESTHYYIHLDECKIMVIKQ